MVEVGTVIFQVKVDHLVKLLFLVRHGSHGVLDARDEDVTLGIRQRSHEGNKVIHGLMTATIPVQGVNLEQDNRAGNNTSKRLNFTPGKQSSELAQGLDSEQVTAELPTLNQNFLKLEDY